MIKIAIITGASSGLGYDFTKEIDKKGIDQIWIVARRLNLLEKLSKELKTEAKIFNMDITNFEDLNKIEKELETNKYEIKYLINNAGFGLQGNFYQLDITKQLNMIDLNIKSLVKITYFSIKYMNKGSEIIQIASTAGFLPMKHFAVYAASKAFVLNFSNAIASELKNKGINSIAISPGPVATEFFDIASKGKQPPFAYKSIDVVRKALKDSKKKRWISIYGFIMKTVMFFSHFTPRRIKTVLASKSL